MSKMRVTGECILCAGELDKEFRIGEERPFIPPKHIFYCDKCMKQLGMVPTMRIKEWEE